MKRLIIFLLTLLVLSCAQNKENSFSDGFYFNKNDLEVYHFDKDTVIKYNFLDSTINDLVLKINEKSLMIGNNNYDYKNYDQDSVIIYDFENGKIEDLCLIKFEYKEFNIMELHGTEWMHVKSNAPVGYIRFNNDIGIYNLHKYKHGTSGIMSMPDYLDGKNFNKFYLYTGIVPFLVVSYDENNMLNLDIGENNKFKKSLFTRIDTKKMNPILKGKWLKLKDTLKKNRSTYYNYYFNLESEDLKNQQKIDSINELFDYSNIEFTSDNYFIRTIKNSKNILIKKYELDYNPNTNYIFLNNPYFKDINDPDIENQFMVIKKLTKDTLTIQISEPFLTYTYIRSSNDLY